MAKKRMGRPPANINPEQLKVILRLRPTLKDVADYFECDINTILRFIRKNYDLTFDEYRDQNMVHTRIMLITKALQKAEKGDNAMLIFCLKNLCEWKDRYEPTVNVNQSVTTADKEQNKTALAEAKKTLEAIRSEREEERKQLAEIESKARNIGA